MKPNRLQRKIVSKNANKNKKLKNFLEFQKKRKSGYNRIFEDESDRIIEHRCPVCGCEVCKEGKICFFCDDDFNKATTDAMNKCARLINRAFSLKNHQGTVKVTFIMKSKGKNVYPRVRVSPRSVEIAAKKKTAVLFD